MSSASRSSSGRKQEDGEEHYGGYVASRARTAENSVASASNRSHKTPKSWAAGEEYQVPIHRLHHPDEILSSSFVSSPLPRPLGTKKMRRGPPSSKASKAPSSSLEEPPTMSSLPEQQLPSSSSDGRHHHHPDSSSFKGWLTSGVFGALNSAAGLTLSTMAPPLQNILIPGLVALFIDTMDTVTPPRVKDWFRILSSSVYHLFSVLRSTTRGQSFSDQFVRVLQDIVQVMSAPESRQVLVDGMACSVKLADALHTPEMEVFLDQLSILGCRVVDAAASGKSKQLLHDTKDLVWKGIGTATDPAATLALAEVTAHLCHVLEDTQQQSISNNNNPRAVRNAQNQATYLNPFQVKDAPQQQQEAISIEEIILSCLGLEEEEDDDDDTEEEGEEEDAGSIPSNVVWNEDTTTTDQTHSREWKERGERVNVELLKERILHNGRRPPQARGNPGLSVISSVASADDGLLAEHHLSAIPSNDDADDGEVDETVNQTTRNVETPSSKPNDDIANNDTNVTTERIICEEDMEDINWTRLPDKNKTPQGDRFVHDNHNRQTEEVPAVLRFYRTLDDLLERKRAQRVAEQESSDEEFDFSDQRASPSAGSAKDTRKFFNAKVKKLRDGQVERRRARTIQRRKGLTNLREFANLHQGYALVVLVIFLWCTLVLVGFAGFGMYTFVQMQSKATSHVAQTVISQPRAANPEVVIRIIREVVHVREDGSVIDTASDDSAVSDQELEMVTDCVASAFG